MFIDQDDYYHSGVFDSIYEYLSTINLEILIVDCTYERPGIANYKLQHNFSNHEVMTGDQQIARNSLPWAPWKFIFLRSLVVDNEIFFKEHERIEDIDWVHRLAHAAQRVQYQPILFIHYIKNDISTTMTSFFSKETMYSTLRCGRRLYDLTTDEFAKSTDEVRNCVRRVGISVYGLGIRNYLFCRDNVSIKSKAIRENVYVRNAHELTGFLKVAVLYPRLFSIFSNLTAFVFPFLISLHRKWKYRKGKNAFA